MRLFLQGVDWSLRDNSFAWWRQLLWLHLSYVFDRVFMCVCDQKLYVSIMNIIRTYMHILCTYMHICKHTYIHMHLHTFLTHIRNSGIQHYMHMHCIRWHTYVNGQVTIGEVQGQGVRIASRCLWDVETDNHASAYYTNPHCEFVFWRPFLRELDHMFSCPAHSTPPS
jgi:hypothetical protein